MIDTQALLKATNIVDLIGDTVRLKKQGQQYYGLCPMHADRAPTLRVDPKKGLWYCPACQVGGDAVDWLTKTEGLDFKTAAAELAKRAGIDATARPGTRAPQKPRFPHPDPRPSTPWGGQHLMAGDRAVYILNDFPGRARYLDLAERHPGVDLIWWPRPHSIAAEMYLEPIALARIITEPFPGLWEAYRAAALVDAIAGWRARYRGAMTGRLHDALMIEAMRVEGWLEWHMQGREIAPGIGAPAVDAEPIAKSAGNYADSMQARAHPPSQPVKEVTTHPAGAPSPNETGHAAAA